MPQYTRNNAWNNSGTFDNPDLLWYAKGVAAMQAIQLDQTDSWYFFAATHGEYIARPKFPGWGHLPAPPQVPTSPIPAHGVSAKYWNQCQHQSWYFVPWHRGYLISLEAHIRQEVVKLGGPDSWALPYWNYFGPGDQYKIPPAFTQKNLPNGSPNALFVNARYGPDSDGNIYIPTAAGIAKHPGDPNFGSGEVTEECMQDTEYTGTSPLTPNFGGVVTGFSHGGRTSGDLEGNPHNLVHVYVGGSSPDGQTPGLMSIPAIAALDPIFYLHHANIDRMWAVWNSTKTNTNPTENDWLKGPPATGGREFVMPNPDGSAWVYTPEEMDNLSKVDYTYDHLPALKTPVLPFAVRLTNLGAVSAAAKVTEGVALPTPKSMELVGASQQGITLNRAGATTQVAFHSAVREKVSNSLKLAAIAQTPETATPDRVFVNLENVRGTFDASVLSVYINLPDGTKPADHPELLAGSVGLFGLSGASEKDGDHGGEGLNFVLEITKIVDQLHLNNAFDVDSLQVRVVPRQPLPEQAQITIGRISVYRQGE